MRAGKSLLGLFIIKEKNVKSERKKVTGEQKLRELSGPGLQHVTRGSKPLNHHETTEPQAEQVENPSGALQHSWAPCQPLCWHVLMPGDMGSGQKQ